MIILAYLISTTTSTSQGPSVHDRILFGSRTTEEGDEEHLDRFSKILFNLVKERTFEALHDLLPFKWNYNEKYDTVNPFGDVRDYQYHSLWTFDTRNDVLRYTNSTHSSQIPLSLLRERSVSLYDMKQLGGPIPPLLDHAFDPEPPYWTPQVHVDDRIRTFTHRLLRDFHHQWRHILRNDYNVVTLRVLSRAIIQLSTLDFEVRENAGGHGPRGVHVWITQLPTWQPLESNIVRVGTAWVIICESIKDGLSIVQEHVASREVSATMELGAPTYRDAHAHYMILTVKHIMLCYTRDGVLLQHTAPEPLFNGDYGTSSPSELALDFLIWATDSARPSISTPIQSLPIEIQDAIIKYTSVGTVSGAKLGCMLLLGSRFLWKDGLLKVTLEERHVIRPSGSSVESQIWFGNHKSGIVYLARAP